MSLWEWLFRRRQREEDLEEEVQSHLRMAAQERMQQGKSAEEVKNELLPLANFPRGGRDLIPAAIEAVFTQLAETPVAPPVPPAEQE